MKNSAFEMRVVFEMGRGSGHDRRFEGLGMGFRVEVDGW